MSKQELLYRMEKAPLKQSRPSATKGCNRKNIIHLAWKHRVKINAGIHEGEKYGC